MKPSLLTILALFISLSFSCSKEEIETIETTQPSTNTLYNVVPECNEMEIKVLELVNQYRASLNLSLLEKSSKIKAVAFSHTDYMIKNHDVSHANFNQRSAYLTDYYGAKTVGENVAYGFVTAEATVNGWIKSEGHRKIMESNFTHFEISAKQCPKGKWYYTLMFIKK